MAKTKVARTATGVYSYLPFTAVSPWPTPLITPQPLLPLLPHPEKVAPPQPVRPELAPPPTGWTRSVHAAPAAYPKNLREAHGTFSRSSRPWGPEPPTGESKEARTSRQAGELHECVRQRYAAKHWSIEEALAANPRGHWISVERWRRDKPAGGYTLVLTHANGLQREVSRRNCRGRYEWKCRSRPQPRWGRRMYTPLHAYSRAHKHSTGSLSSATSSRVTRARLAPNSGAASQSRHRRISSLTISG
jgi:hypothetical protein